MSNDLGVDRSGNNNHWSVNNMTYSDQMLDTPTNNFCTWNPSQKDEALPAATRGFAQGNLQCTTTGLPYGAANGRIFGTIGVTSGKWYYEWVMTTDSSSVGSAIGWADNDHSDEVAYYVDGTIRGSGSSESYGATWGIGDIIGIAFNADTNAITYYKNGASQGEITISDNHTFGTNQAYFPFVWDGSGNPTITGVANFGQDSSFAGTETAQGNQDDNSIGDFYYDVPAGFMALCTSNLPAVAVVPSEHFNTVLWTGTTSVDRDITGIGFDPSLVWIKSRSDAYEQLWFDKVRGAGERLMSHNTNAESTNDSTLNAFITDGFTLGNGSTVDLSVNGNTSKTYVSWNWKANGSGSSNTDGTITSTVSVNTDAGFSIVGWTQTGYTDSIGHGLSKTPEMIILKSRSATTANWWVYTNTGGTGKGLVLNDTAAMYTSSDVFPTVDSTKFIQGSEVYSGGSNVTYIAYCFHSVDGYSKVGSYTGNGNADGTFVYTGFRPAYVMVKRTDSTSNWRIIDSERNEYNGLYKTLTASTSSAEYSGSDDFGNSDILSNGFKLRQNYAEVNASGGTYIYLAFAETPFKYSNAR